MKKINLTDKEADYLVALLRYARYQASEERVRDIIDPVLDKVTAKPTFAQRIRNLF